MPPGRLSPPGRRPFAGRAHAAAACVRVGAGTSTVCQPGGADAWLSPRARTHPSAGLTPPRTTAGSSRRRRKRRSASPGASKSGEGEGKPLGDGITETGPVVVSHAPRDDATATGDEVGEPLSHRGPAVAWPPLSRGGRGRSRQKVGCGRREGQRMTRPGAGRAVRADKRGVPHRRRGDVDTQPGQSQPDRGRVAHLRRLRHGGSRRRRQAAGPRRSTTPLRAGPPRPASARRRHGRGKGAACREYVVNVRGPHPPCSGRAPPRNPFHPQETWLRC